MSGLFSSTVIKGNRLTDFSNTSASVGNTIPFGYGRFVTDGNVIWAPLPPKEHVTRKRQGKGGVKTETYTYTLSYAIAFCKGPIFGYWWIKRNGKIVYTQDPAAPVEDKAYATKWLQKATLYYGTKTQLPDSTIESYEGAGQVSAFRDLGYAVLEDDDVTDGSGAVPQYEACVIATADTYFTTPPYPILASEDLDTSISLIGIAANDGFIDHLDTLIEVTGGEHREMRIDYDNNPPDELDTSITLTGGEHREMLIEYEDNPPDELDTSITLLGGTYEETLITYSNNPPDELDTSITLLGGSFS